MLYLVPPDLSTSHRIIFTDDFPGICEFRVHFYQMDEPALGFPFICVLTRTVPATHPSGFDTSLHGTGRTISQKLLETPSFPDGPWDCLEGLDQVLLEGAYIMH